MLNAPLSAPQRIRSPGIRALTLVEVMVAMALMAGVMLGFIGTFVQSRRATEGSVLQSAATSLVYGLFEQMKGLDYQTLIPSYDVDPYADDEDPTKVPPYIRLRLHQDKTTWLRVVHTRSTDSPNTPKAPLTCPSTAATAQSVGAIDNLISNLPLSTVTGTSSQDLSLNLWVWIDEIPDVAKDVSEVKRVTIVYTYTYKDVNGTKTIREMEVFLRTRYDQ